ncbi:MAG: hypothetical protein UR68_C0009G0007 [Candidatus Roizmanbacteria bacterium GW2011_GWA2_35_19]|uniref:CBS domain-containing protein n=2 Tax=Candidatus Roizmaniibacteriota TaxID=1752723 RepID=A0A0G0F0Y5_9BACT|nr:MAG: hypothetical protein UR63_C0004G0008 [Candidatus Roizmanbacteria bacterium GW2011_GWC2_35_12]KKP73062.1 MAG: hypothetical protein UR68_C0009G0007 [Candidatus Roizmanbacteria bacterium GW2011_GWA2_35_19]
MIDLQDILKKDKIIKVSPDETLTKALSRLSTSHDAGFVFDADDKYIGVINPYYSLIKSSHPGNSKVLHCLHHPPKIYIDFSLSKVAELLIQSKIHYLPVLDRKDNFLGIISARRLLTHLKELPIFKEKISVLFRFPKRPLVVIYEDESIAKAVHIFKTSKFSKIIVINRDMKLKGILSYYDLISFMVTPKGQGGRREKVGDKSHINSQPVKNFVKTFVLTLKKEGLVSDAFKLMIDKKIGSVILVDEERHPVGIITTRDLLRYFIDKERFQFLTRASSKIRLFLSRKRT